MIKRISSYILPLIIVVIILLFFWKIFLSGLIPIPTDTIVGLYYPFRDYYAKEFPRGIPFANFLITDPVRQQIPWKELAINSFKNFNIPLWNPYSFSGTPLLANFQSGVFYPINLIFLFIPFIFSWTVLIILQPILAFIFLFSFLRNLKLSKTASVFGAFAFSFSGFSVSWLEWGNVLHTALWLPLILLSIDKIFENKSVTKWFVILLLSTAFSFFAGHLQIFFYLFLMTIIYMLFRWLEHGKSRTFLLLFTVYCLLFIAVTAVQWLPSLQFINLSARSLDQAWQVEGWFIPWQNAIQFITPDFFGNPATLNYFGVFNYGEFVGYVGIIPLIFGLFSLIKKDRNIIFFWFLIIVSAIFAFPTFIAEIPYRLSIPFISTAQPTRLIFIMDFCISVLAAFGINYFLKKTDRKIFFPLAFVGALLCLLWIYTKTSNLLVSSHNLILPTLIFVASFIVLAAYIFLANKLKHKKIKFFISIILIFITVLDLFRFGWKYETFSSQNYFYPQTKSLAFLQKNLGNYRIISTDSRIMPPNFPVIYNLASVEGYDPLYLQRYAELSIAIERGRPDIKPPFGFNRIITLKNYNSDLINLLGVKYILTFDDLTSLRFKKIYEEGQTKIYENFSVLPRAYFVDSTVSAPNKQAAISNLFKIDVAKEAVVEGQQGKIYSKGKATVKSYTANRVEIHTDNKGEGFLVLTDSFYPTWHAKIDGMETPIVLTDYNFRGISVPAGNHTIVFEDKLF